MWGKIMTYRCFENVAQFTYLGTTTTNQNLIRDEIKRILNSGNACYHSVKNLLSSCLSKNIKIRIYKTIILLVVLYGCQTWSLALREEHRLSVFENKMLRKIFGSKKVEATGGWRTLLNEDPHNLCSFPNIIRMIKSRRMRWAGHVVRMGEKGNTYRILEGKPEGKRPLGRSRHRSVIIIKWILERQGGVIWSGLTWLRIGTSGGLL
jgi:hypothetical protein